MSTLSFAGDMARLQRAFTEIARRGRPPRIVLEALNLRTGERVLELGCGGGYFTHEADQFVGPTGRVCAIDISPDQIAAAQVRCAEFAWSNAARRILRRRRTGTPSLMSFSPSRRSSICRISTVRCATSIGFSVQAGG